jgi:hypothetical protein
MECADNGQPEDIREHMRLMCDILAVAFQTDKTRVATLLLCRDISGTFYPFLDVRSSHHPASHDDRSDAYECISRYCCSQLAYLAGGLGGTFETGRVSDYSDRGEDERKLVQHVPLDRGSHGCPTASFR